MTRTTVARDEADRVSRGCVRLLCGVAAVVALTATCGAAWSQVVRPSPSLSQRSVAGATPLAGRHAGRPARSLLSQGRTELGARRTTVGSQRRVMTGRGEEHPS